MRRCTEDVTMTEGWGEKEGSLKEGRKDESNELKKTQSSARDKEGA